MMRSSGGSFGLQIGGQATDFVIMVMNDAGARSVMKGNAKLGAETSIAAGPVGKAAEASTTATMQAQMLSYCRSKGVFGGVSLFGTSLAPITTITRSFMERKSQQTRSFQDRTAPSSASDLTATLEQTSPKKVVEAAK